ncbi:Mitochondrial glycoprotein family protein [Perilla frutescens var. hirtella]|nr:Mitochondrial glycoprotein family protein [Perilla frutescens var. frutescens]KAH6800749.1 Mitochondrial glycoprotein family protein [Perilla frutescens var. hirtella]
MAHRIVRGLRGAVKNLVFQHPPKPINQFLKSSTRNYASDMQKSAFEGNILRLIRNEIQYELDHSPPSKAVPEFNSFKIDERPGEQWIRLSRNFGENEEIKIEVTMFDGSVPMKMNDEKEDVKLHVTLIVDVIKGKDCDVLEFVCCGWPDSIEIRKVFTRGHDGTKDELYMGPEFKELDDELQDSLYDFLEERGIDDKLTEFLHKYMWNKDKNEYLRWMGSMRTYIQNK